MKTYSPSRPLTRWGSKQNQVHCFNLQLGSRVFADIQCVQELTTVGGDSANKQVGGYYVCGHVTVT